MAISVASRRSSSCSSPDADFAAVGARSARRTSVARRGRRRGPRRDAAPALLALGPAPEESGHALRVRPQLRDVHRLRGVLTPPGARGRDRSARRPRAPDRAAGRPVPRVRRARAAHRPRHVHLPLRRLCRRMGAAKHGGRGRGTLRPPAPLRAPDRRRHARRPRRSRVPRGEARAHGPLRQAPAPAASGEDRRAHRGDPALVPRRARRARHGARRRRSRGRVRRALGPHREPGLDDDARVRRDRALPVSFFVLAWAILGLAIPTPGGVGGYPTAVAYALTAFYGVGKATAGAFALVSHALSRADHARGPRLPSGRRAEPEIAARGRAEETDAETRAAAGSSRIGTARSSRRPRGQVRLEHLDAPRRKSRRRAGRRVDDARGVAEDALRTFSTSKRSPRGMLQCGSDEGAVGVTNVVPAKRSPHGRRANRDPHRPLRGLSSSQLDARERSRATQLLRRSDFGEL